MAAMEESKKQKVEGKAVLTYFHGWGLAEQCRWVLAAADIPFDQR